MSDKAMRAWEMFIRVIAITVCIGGPVLGYQLSKLDEADKESMTDRNLLRERVAITEEKARTAEAATVEIKASLRRIEDSLDKIKQRP